MLLLPLPCVILHESLSLTILTLGTTLKVVDHIEEGGRIAA